MENNTSEQAFAQQTTEKLPYQSPELKQYGEIVDLVQFNTGTGTDGGGFPNNTLS